MIARPGRLFRILLLGGFLVLGQAPAASAADPSPSQPARPTPPAGATLSAEPSVITASVRPGSSITETLSLHSGIALDIAIEAQGLGQSAQDGSFTFLPADDDKSPYTARPFITVDPATFSMKPGDTRQAKVTIDLPAGAADGERFSLLKVNGLPASGSDNVGIGVALGVSVLVTLPDSPQTRTGVIRGLAVAGGAPGEKVMVTGSIQNTGNTHYGAPPYAITETATLRNREGDPLAVAQAKTAGNSIIPTFARGFELPLEPARSLGAGTYTVEVVATLEDGTVLDRATVELRRPGESEGGVTVTTSRDDLLPLILAGGIGAAIAALLLVLYVGSRRLRRRPTA